jgi:hypothetical protein
MSMTVRAGWPAAFSARIDRRKALPRKKDNKDRMLPGNRQLQLPDGALHQDKAINAANALAFVCPPGAGLQRW